MQNSYLLHNEALHSKHHKHHKMHSCYICVCRELVSGFADLWASAVWESAFRYCVTSKYFTCTQVKHLLKELNSDLWTGSRCRPWRAWSAGRAGSVRARTDWRWGVCRPGQSSDSSDPPMCACCRGRWSVSWGTGPRAGPRSGGMPTDRSEWPSARAAAGEPAAQTRLSERRCDRRRSWGDASENTRVNSDPAEWN